MTIKRGEKLSDSPAPTAKETIESVDEVLKIYEILFAATLRQRDNLIGSHYAKSESVMQYYNKELMDIVVRRLGRGERGASKDT